MRYFLIFSFAFLLASCVETSKTNHTNTTESDTTSAVIPDSHNSRNSLDWEGRYTGVFPCADCEGIETTVVLIEDTFSLRQIYLGTGVEPFEESGNFKWTDDGGSIILHTSRSGDKRFKVGENFLFLLDEEGNEPEGVLAEHYKLAKAFSNPEIENITWELVELDGQKIDTTENVPFFILQSNEGRISGSLGCNRFFGTYKLKDPLQISLGPLGATQMACRDMKIENRLSKVFEEIDNYAVDDNTLYLHKARMAPIAVFKARSES